MARWFSRRPSTEPRYAPETRAERLIATSRVVLAAFSLLALLVDPSEPRQYARTAHVLVGGYLVYAVILAAIGWRAPLLRPRLVTHVLDLLIFSLFMYFTEGPTSPFFVYFVFSIVCATLRWQWRGAAWTAVGALAIFIGMGYAAERLGDPAFELNRFIIRGVYLAVVAGLLGYLGAYEERLRRDLSRLAAWPQHAPHELPALLLDVMEHAASVLQSPRLVIAWEERDEPWLHLASWGADGLQQKREAPDRFQPLVVGALEGTDFACTDADAAAPTVLHTSRGGLQRWRGRPLHPELRVRFATSSVLSFALRGGSFQGRVFALDKPGLTSDDLFLGQVVAQQLTAKMDHFYFLEQLREGATTEERLRLARDLHDGVLQSLSGTALQLQAARQLLDRDPGAAKERLLDIQCLIADEQRDLRHTIHYLKPATSSPPEAELSLTARMRELARRLERHWGVRVELSSGALEGRIPNTLARHIYSLVHEALINAARHSGGSAARAMIRASSDHVHIVVADNGRGFPFRGRYDLAALRAQSLGPMTLKERVAALGGTMIIESVESGARLELTVPLEPRVA